jgi:acyl-CoA thioesterase
MDKQQLAEKVVKDMFEKDAFSIWLGISIVKVQPGQVVIAMKVRSEMLNGFNKSHGGIVFSLADSAVAFASNTHGRVSLSIENSISYPTPVSAGDTLTATATEHAIGNHTATYLVTITKQDNSVVGLFRGTVYRTNKVFFEG